MNSEFGGKGRSLLQLKAFGFQVPQFTVLTPSILKGLDREALKAKLLQILEQEGLQFPLAVRSSANAEDGLEQSFAGMFETILDVKDFDSVVTAVEKVLASQNSQRVLHYNQQSVANKLEMAIVLQKMVKATRAGVLFTANPVNGQRSQMMVSAVEGLGEQLVSGEVDGETIILSTEGQVLEPQNVRTLSQVQLNQLYQAGRQAALRFGRPLDIEWAFENDELFLLQARPITSSLAGESLQKFVFDNSNIQESYCGVTTPLTFSYASEAYCQVYNQLMKLMGFSSHEIEKAQWRHKHLLGFINGRVYYNINCWYEGLLYLPNFGRRKDDMEKMMGLEKPVDFVRDYQISTTEKIRRILPMVQLVAKMLFRFSRIDQDVARFDRWFWQLYKKYDRQNLQFLETDVLVDSLRRLQEESLEEWGVPVLNDFLVMLTYGTLKREMDNLGLAERFQEAMKGSDIVSLQPTLELQKIASDLMTMAEADLDSKVSEFVELYGDRSMGELKLETQTYRQNRHALWDLIRQMARSASGRFSIQEQFEIKESEFLKAYQAKAGFWKSRRIQKKLNKLKKAVADRELMRFHRTRIFGMMRSYYLEIGNRLEELGALQEQRDIFYLTRDEVFDFFYGKSATANLKSLVQIRKTESEDFEKMEMPAQVAVSQPVGYWMKSIQPDVVHAPLGGTLQGLGCARGKVRGKVRFIRNPNEAAQLEGCILLAERTDPGWTPLFTLVKGVIIERGSALSHSAVIAREMGLPAVVGVANATRWIQDGDEVEIDGNCGRIEIITSRSGEARSFTDHQALAK